MIGSVLLLAGALQVASGESVRANQIADRYGAQADITFTVVDESGKGVPGVRLKARNSIDLDLTTDENGVARYRGVAWKDLNVAVSGEGIYTPLSCSWRLENRSADGRVFAPTSMPPIVVRRVVNPHPMTRISIPFTLENGCGLVSNDYVTVEYGLFEGQRRETYGSNMGRASYIILTPTSPDDGFQILPLSEDSLALPLEAPADGYRNGPLYQLNRFYYTDDKGLVPAFCFDPDRYQLSETPTCVAFRHRTDKGFVYGVIWIDYNGENYVMSFAGRKDRRSCATPTGIGILVNPVPGVRSIEPGKSEGFRKVFAW